MMWEICIAQDPWGMIHVLIGDHEWIYSPGEVIEEIVNNLKELDEDYYAKEKLNLLKPVEIQLINHLEI